MSQFAASRGSRAALAGRSLYLKVMPTPRTLTERRAILQLLKKFGEVSMFKRLEHTQTFVSLMRTNAQAQAVISRSPLVIEVAKQELTDDYSMIAKWTNTSPVSVLTKIAQSLPDGPDPNPSESTEAPPGASTPAGLSVTPFFTVHIFPTKGYSHKKTIRASPLHGPWPEADGDRPVSYVTADLASMDLAGNVRETAAFTGLKTWDTDSLRFNREILFFGRRQARRNSGYQGAVPRLLTRRRGVLEEAGLLGRGAFASVLDPTKGGSEGRERSGKGGGEGGEKRTGGKGKAEEGEEKRLKLPFESFFRGRVP